MIPKAFLGLKYYMIINNHNQSYRVYLLNLRLYCGKFAFLLYMGYGKER